MRTGNGDKRGRKRKFRKMRMGGIPDDGDDLKKKTAFILLIRIQCLVLGMQEA